MTENIEKEVIRLVKEVASDERDLMRAERYENRDNIGRYERAINRKLELIQYLTKERT